MSKRDNRNRTSKIKGTIFLERNKTILESNMERVTKLTQSTTNTHFSKGEPNMICQD